MAVSQAQQVQAALRDFANDVAESTKLRTTITASPEDQLKAPVKDFIRKVGTALGLNVSVLSESPVEDVGRPDLAIAVNGLLVGYIELKAPGIGTTQSDFRGQGHNLLQLRKFKALPNLVYTDARDWTYYIEGQSQRSYNVRLGEIDETGDSDLTEADAADLLELLRQFLKWEPIVPRKPRELAKVLAPLTRLLRTAVQEAAAKQGSALAQIHDDWKRTLFPEASVEEFADSYAQTLTYGLLLAKLSGGTALDTHSAAKSIEHHSSLLSRTLEILTQHGTADELGPSLQLLERTIDAVDPSGIRSDEEDPWLYFYEDFLAEYDPQLRNERGVYYTPAAVVKAQVTLVDELLRTRLGKDLGIADKDVTVLDPATGTGTYLLQALQQGIDNAIAKYGPGAEGSIASQMARNLYGFELLVGPYAVAHLRLNQAVTEHGGREPKNGVHIYLTDTLESPNETRALPHSYFEAPLAEEHRRAREVKRKTKILVCIGNPPYEREEADSDVGASGLDMGGWVRNGDQQTSALLETFLWPAREAGAGRYLRNLYNSYVYFWRWALWKVLETQTGPGIVSFITGSSYLKGLSFVGMREEMRRAFDELWILDLEGDSRGTRTTENVFDIRTPVAIAVGIRYGEPSRDTPARVNYLRLTGRREEKFSILNSFSLAEARNWEQAPSDWQRPFIPATAGDYYEWPQLPDIFPWQHPGAQYQRNWPIGESRTLLERRWKHLLANDNRAQLFRESSDRKVHLTYSNQTGDGARLPAISTLSQDIPVLGIERIGFRSFDTQWALLDPRLADRIRPQLWSVRSDYQIYMTSLFEISVNSGPAVTFTSYVPDRHHFRGSYSGKDVLPLYRDAASSNPNVTQSLLALLSKRYRTTVPPEDLAGYVAGVLGHSGYTEKFHDELEVPGPRVPLTKSAEMFQRAVDLGKQVIAWQTYAERFPESIGTTQGNVPSGTAQLVQEIPSEPEKYPQTLNDVIYDEAKKQLHVGDGIIGNVVPRIWDYEVSGLRVVRSWLGYRVRERSGRKSSPLDDIRPERWTWEMTKELMRLLWVLEGVIALEPAQAELLDEIVEGELFLADELPQPTDAERQAPSVNRAQQQSLF